MQKHGISLPAFWLASLLLIPTLFADDRPTSAPDLPDHARSVLARLQEVFQGLYNVAVPHPTSQAQFAVMTLGQNAGFNQGVQFDPCPSASCFSDTAPVNYVARRPHNTGRYIRHAERMIIADYHNDMINNYGQTHGAPPNTVFLFTVLSPCLSDPAAPRTPSCAQLIADTARDNPGIRYFVGFHRIYNRDSNREAELWTIMTSQDNLVFGQVDSPMVPTPPPRDELRLRKRRSTSTQQDTCWFDLGSADDRRPPLGTWFVIRNRKHVDQCLYSRERDDGFDNYDCHEDYIDQHFKLLDDGDNKVLIKGRDSEKCLHAAQYGYLGHASCHWGSQDEQWELLRDGNTGAFRIEAPQFEKCAYLNNDDDLGIYTCEYDDQLWHLDPVGMYTFPVNSWVKVVNVLRHGQCISASGATSLSHDSCGQVQNHFQLIPVSEAYFKIESRQFPGRCLFSYASGTFSMGTCDATIPDQHWRILNMGETSGTHAYMIRGRESEKCAFINADHDMGVFDCNADYVDQFWHLDSAPDNFPATFPVNIPVQLHNDLRNRCLYARARDSLLSHFDCHAEYVDQHFKITPLSGGVYFHIQSVDTGKCLYSYSDHTWFMWQCSEETLDQHWLIREAAGGTHTLRGRVSDKCAFINAASEIGVYECGYDDQRWNIRPID